MAIAVVDAVELLNKVIFISVLMGRAVIRAHGIREVFPGCSPLDACRWGI